MKKIFIIISIVVILLTGCGKNPMQKLASNTLYSDMTKEFWQKEYNNKTSLWNEALTYCRDNKEKPNCAPVTKIYLDAKWGNTEITGKLNEHPLNLPKF